MRPSLIHHLMEERHSEREENQVNLMESDEKVKG